MFDISFSELIVIGIVALVVIGPERLPKAARTAGLLLGRVQHYVRDIKADISREMHLEDLKKLQADVQQTAHDFERSMADEMKSIEQITDLLKVDTEKPSIEPTQSGQEPANSNALLRPSGESPPP